MLSDITECLRKRKILCCLMFTGIPNLLSDRTYLKIKFLMTMSRHLNLKHPAYFSDKLQWLKLYHRDPRYTNLVDKYEVRKYVAKTLGEAYLVPLLGIWNRFEDIDFDSLPDQFILKCTHESGQYWICRNKKTFDFNKTRKAIKASLRRNYYYCSREWPYKNVKPRIICEELIRTPDDKLPFDYKLYCFNGTPDCVLSGMDVTTDRGIFRFFDRDWNLLDYYDYSHFPYGMDQKIPRPPLLDEMIRAADTLSKGFPFVRVDFYSEGTKIYFSELTFYPDAAFDNWLSLKSDLILGEKLDLSLVGGPSARS